MYINQLLTKLSPFFHFIGNSPIEKHLKQGCSWLFYTKVLKFQCLLPIGGIFESIQHSQSQLFVGSPIWSWVFWLVFASELGEKIKPKLIWNLLITIRFQLANNDMSKNIMPKYRGGQEYLGERVIFHQPRKLWNTVVFPYRKYPLSAWFVTWHDVGWRCGTLKPKNRVPRSHGKTTCFLFSIVASWSEKEVKIDPNISVKILSK